MKLFEYWKDPLFLFSCLAYGLNRWVLKHLLHSAFLHDHFDDLFIIPCALPLVLLLHRKWGWRHHDLPPTGSEIFLHVVVWSIVCKGIAPHLFPYSIEDWWDALCYAIGGLVAWIWWNQTHLVNAFERYFPYVYRKALQIELKKIN